MEQLIRQRYTMNNQARDSLSTAKVKTKFRHSTRENITPLPGSNQFGDEKDSDEPEDVRNQNLIGRDEEEQSIFDNDHELHKTSKVDEDNYNYNNNDISYSSNKNGYMKPNANIILNVPTEPSPTLQQNKRSPNTNSTFNQIIAISNDRLTPLKKPDDYLTTGKILSESNKTNNRETVLPSPTSRSAVINNGPIRRVIDDLDNPQMRTNWLVDEKYGHQNVQDLSSAAITPTLENRQKHYHYERAQEQEQQQIVFIAFGFAVFLLIALAVYNWFHKRRRNEIRSSTKYGDLFDSLPLFPSNCGKVCASSKIKTKEGTRNGSNDSDGSEEMRGFVNSQAKNHGCGTKNKSKGSQLVGRVLPNKTAASEQETEIGEGRLLEEEIQELRNDTTIQQDHPSQETKNTKSSIEIIDENENDEKRLRTMVILRRKIVNHPLIISARSSAKPRVKLIRANVRKFIDDEAADMRNGKRELTLMEALENRFKNLLSTALNIGRKSSNNSAGRTVFNEKLDKKIDQEEGKLQQREIEMDNLENILKPAQHQQQESQVLSVEIHSSNKSENDRNDDQCNTEALQGEGGPNFLLPNQINRKLSPFSVDGLNDAYSSLSACSLFSSSPVDAQQMAQTCACFLPNSYGFNNNIRPGGLAAMQFKKGLDSNSATKNPQTNDNDISRCKSQGHSSISPAQANYNRPCCSASPLAIAQVGLENHQVNNITETASCCRLPSTYHHHNQPHQAQIQPQYHNLHYDQISKRLQNTITNNRSSGIQCHNSARKPSHDDCERSSCNLLPDGSQHISIHDQATASISQYPLDSKKCINHIQRQYENYYDDEQEDAYRRLTASIGMEFGLGFNADTYHHHHRHVPIDTITTSPATAKGYNYNMQPVGVGNRFNHFELDRYSACYNSGQSQLELGLANHMNLHSQFLGSYQGCKCCVNKDPMQSEMKSQQSMQHQQFSQQFAPIMPLDNPCQYLFRSNGGSAGELLSSTSTSTSFGGSDGGFAAAATAATSSNSRQVCHYPSCICQSNEINTFAPQVSMSILVQQPSIGTPPPPPPPQPTSIDEQQLTTKAAANLDESVASSDLKGVTNGDEKSCSIDKESACIGEGPKDNKSLKVQSATKLSASVTTDEASHGTVNKQVSDKIQQFLLKKNIKQSYKPSPRWIHRRRYSQKTQSDMVSEFSQRNSPSTRVARRMSIAGDHVTQSTFGESTNQAFLHRDALLDGDGSPREAAPLASKMASNLQHRSSVVSEGGWNLSGFKPSRPSQQTQQQQQQYQQQPFYNQYKPFGPPYNQHRPSEPSLFDNHHSFSCVTGVGDLNGKSNCSSSGGSSSGIGISGSTCANTPTSTFPNSSFAATPAKFGTEFFTEFPPFNQDRDKAQSAIAYNIQLQNFQLLQQQQQQYQQLIQQHNDQCNYFRDRINHKGKATNIWPPSKYNKNEIATCPSRKFSLPVQLESQVAERVSPNKARLLFKENLQRDDSANISLSSSTQNQVKNTINESIGARQVLSHLDSPTCAINNSSMNSNRLNGLNRILDRRMSSQTITRQSSFWLEDNSVDSILSLATTSGGLNEPDGSQMDVNQSWFLQDQEEKPIQNNSDCTAMANQTSVTAEEDLEDQDVQHSKNSNRPSNSSLILSADSIESVKQKPITMPDQDNDSDVRSSENKNNDNKSFQVGNKEWSSSSNSTLSTGKERRLKTSFAHMRNRLSSSTSTSSTTSSPSPDFSKPSERILGLASKSSSISKRHMFGKLRSRRYPRLVSSTGSGGEASSSGRHPMIALHQNSAPDGRLGKNEFSSQEKEENSTKIGGSTVRSRQDTDSNSVTDKSSQSCSQDNDPDIDGLLAERPISDVNSESL